MARTQKKIPLVDLVAQYKSIRKEVNHAMREVIRSGQFIGGEPVKKFAVEFANIANTPYCVPCANGTDALEMAMIALGIGRGDEVIIPAFTFVATLEAVCNVGATPVLCDVDPDRLSMTADTIKKLITKKTKAIIPVHLYGQVADMEPLMTLSKKHGFYVIEDAAQAHKAEYKGLLAGSIGHVATFSFYPGKNLGAYGDAGAVTTNDESLYERIYKMANHGRTSKYDHEIVGRNSRLDTLQAAVLSVKAEKLEDWIKARRKVAAYYDEALHDIKEIILPKYHAESPHTYHLYVIRVSKHIRDDLRLHLDNAGIETGIHYPIALSQLKVTIDELKIKTSCPVSELASMEVISLPMYPELTTDQQSYICKHIRHFFNAPHHEGSPVITAGKHAGKKKV